MYNVGDKVVIRSWHEVAKERGQEKGKIYCEAHCVYDFSMNDYAGETAVIEEVQEYRGTGEFWYQLVSESGESFPYYWTDSMLARRDADAKQTDDAAEDKIADRPQILKGDIVRFISAITGEENVEVVRCKNTEAYFNPAFGEVLAVYRFDGHDFKCVWESVGYKFDRFKRIIDGINKTKLTLSVKLKSVNEAMKKLRKEAGEKASE